MIASFSKVKADMVQIVSSIQYREHQKEFKVLLPEWESYESLKSYMRSWWQIMHWEETDDFEYDVLPKQDLHNIQKLFIERGYVTVEDEPMIARCRKQITDRARDKNLTWRASSTLLYFRSLDEAYQLQSTIGDEDLYGILDI